MNDKIAIINSSDPLLESDFATEMVRQMRAIDTYGSCDDGSVAQILAPFVLTREQKRELPVVGDPDEIILSRVTVFYNAIAVMIEKECGLMAVPIMNISYEGFGRVLITVGKLVVLDKVLRDIHRFGFPNLSKMKDEADKLLSVALEIIGLHSRVAGMN